MARGRDREEEASVSLPLYPLTSFERERGVTQIRLFRKILGQWAGGERGRDIVKRLNKK